MKTVYTLTAQNIDEVSEKIAGFLQGAGMDRRSILRIRLLYETALLNWRSSFGETHEFALSLNRRMRMAQCVLSTKGSCVNPFEADDGMVQHCMAVNGLVPEYVYSGGTNTVSLVQKVQNKNTVIPILIAIAAAVVCGLGGRMLPSNAIAVIQKGCSMLISTFMSLLRCIAMPLILCSIVTGIGGMGDITTFGSTGKGLFRLMLRYILITTVLCILIQCFVFEGVSVQGLGDGGAADVGALAQMVLDILPGDIISSFQNSNTAQIMVIGIAIGCCLLVLQKHTEGISSLFEQTNKVTRLLMQGLTGLMPYYVFLSLTNLLVGSSLHSLSDIGILVLEQLVMMALFMAAALVLTSLRLNVPLRTLFRKYLPPVLVALSTGSSAAAFSTEKECCEGALGAEKSFAGFALPIGIAMFHIGVSISMPVYSLFFMDYYGVTVTASALFTILLTTVIFTVAVPSVPNGSLIAYTMLLPQLGLPLEAVTLVAALDTFMSFFFTACNQFFVLNMVTVGGAGLNKLDMKKLREPV